MLSLLVSLVMSLSMTLTGTAHGWKFVPLKHTKSVLMNCEETDRTPCVTLDDGSWRKVTSYSPYRYQRISKCKSAKGGPKFPCAYPIKGTYKFNFYK